MGDLIAGAVARFLLLVILIAAGVGVIAGVIVAMVWK